MLLPQEISYLYILERDYWTSYPLHNILLWQYIPHFQQIIILMNYTHTPILQKLSSVLQPEIQDGTAQMLLMTGLGLTFCTPFSTPPLLPNKTYSEKLIQLHTSAVTIRPILTVGVESLVAPLLSIFFSLSTATESYFPVSQHNNKTGPWGVQPLHHSQFGLGPCTPS